MSNVIEIGEASMRIRARRYVAMPEECQHKQLTYDEQGEIITCNACGKQVSAFWAMKMIAEAYDKAAGLLKRQLDELTAARQEDQHLLAARKLSDAWRKRNTVPCCPHCSRGILSTDRFGYRMVSKAMELRRRQVEATKE